MLHHSAVAPAAPASLGELERTYDGPIPDSALAAALLDRSGAALLLRARAEAAFFSGMVRGQLRTLRRRTLDGSFYPALVDDLRLYRRHHRAWQRLAAQLVRRTSQHVDHRLLPHRQMPGGLEMPSRHLESNGERSEHADLLPQLRGGVS